MPEWVRSEPVDAAQYIGEEAPWDCDLGELESDVATMAHDPAPILTSFSLSVVSVHCSIASGKGLVRFAVRQ